MRTRDYQSLVRRTALAYNLNSSEYDELMDKAATEVDDWEKFCTDLDDAAKTHPTARQIEIYARKKRKDEIEAAERNLHSAQKRYNELVLKQKEKR